MLVSRSGETPAYGLKTLVTPDGVVHLVWKQTRAGASDVLRHVASADGGRTWSAPDDVVARLEFGQIEATADRCGALHVVYRHLEPESGMPRIDYVRWREGWSEPRFLFPSLDVDEFDLLATSDDRLLLVFPARPAEGSPYGPRETVVSEMRIR